MSNFEDHFPRLSPASVSPLRMRFDACLFLQNHPQMQPSDLFNLGTRDIILPCGCLPDSIFYSSTLPVRHPFSRHGGRHPARWPGMRRKWRHLKPIKCCDAFWIRPKVTLGITLDKERVGKKTWNSPNTYVTLFSWECRISLFSCCVGLEETC